jgi:hypothetical protein
MKGGGKKQLEMQLMTTALSPMCNGRREELDFLSPGSPFEDC